MTFRRPIVLGFLLLLVGGFIGALDGLLSQGFTPSVMWSRPVDWVIGPFPIGGESHNDYDIHSWNGCSYLWTPEWRYSGQGDFFGQAHRAAVSRCDI